MLLDAWARGDRAAGDELFERYFDPLYRFFAAKVGDAIEDLVQETFAACVAGHSRIRRESTFRAFLFGTARNLLFAHYRRRRRDAVEAIGERSMADLDPSASAHLVRRAEERLILEALRNLSLDHQIALELYEWEELTGSEVASTLGISEAAFRSRLHRARLELRREVERLGESPQVLRSTLADLDGWARNLRAQLGR